MLGGVYIYSKHHRTMVPPPRLLGQASTRPTDAASWRDLGASRRFWRVNLPSPAVNALTLSVSFPSHPVALLSHVVALAQLDASSRAVETK